MILKTSSNENIQSILSNYKSSFIELENNDNKYDELLSKIENTNFKIIQNSQQKDRKNSNNKQQSQQKKIVTQV